MGTIVISKKMNGYKYSYNNYRGHALFVSLSFESIDACSDAIEQLKKFFDALEIEHKKTPSGKLFFRVTLKGELIGNSRKFSTPLLLEKGLNDFKSNFEVAEVLDFTLDVFETIDDDRARFEES